MRGDFILLLLMVAVSVVVAQVKVNGGWSPWQVDADIDCCMYGGYERVKRYCNNPLPENGGDKCTDVNGTKTTQEERWRTCVCQCYPLCDGVTSFCANDTGKPAHCLCNHGLVTPEGWDTTTNMTCIEPVATATVAPTAATVCETMSSGWTDAVKICRIVAGAWVIIWCVAVMLLFFTFCIFSPERVIHLMEELTVIFAWILIIVPFEEFIAGDEGPCMIVSIFHQFFFLAAMMYFFLEALHAYSMVTYVVPRDGFFHKAINILLGIGLAVIVTGISVPIVFDHYGKNGCHCFCDVSTGQAWVFILPLTLLAFAGGITGEAAAQEKYKALSDSDPDQINHAQVSQRGVLFVMPCALLAYIFALLATDLASPVMWILFTICSLILGPLIFFYHTMADRVVGTWLHNLFKFLPCYKMYGIQEEAQTNEPLGAPTPRDNKADYDDFYKWVTDGRDENLSKESENVLFKPK